MDKELVDQEIAPEVSLKLIREFFQRKDATEDWILKLIGIIETNGHEIPIPDASNGHINRRVIGESLENFYNMDMAFFFSGFTLVSVVKKLGTYWLSHKKYLVS